MKKTTFNIKDFYAVAIIIISTFLILRGFSNRIDINLTDDTGYLILGLRIFQLPLAGFGPLYSIMYKVLKQFTGSDIITLYDTAMYLMYMIPPVTAYIMIRILGLSYTWALLLSCGFLISPNIMSFITWSKISHYTIIIIMLWVIVSTQIKSPFRLFFSLVVLTFLLGYIRPESHLSWYISSGLFLIFWWFFDKEKFRKKKVFAVGSLFVLLSIFIILNVGSKNHTIEKINTLVNPMAGGRSNIAFAQQFSYNYCEWNHLNNFDWIQWRDITKENFGDFNTIGEAYHNNPKVFIKHIAYNIQQYFIKLTKGSAFIFFPPAVFKWASFISIILFFTLIIIRVGYVGFRNWWQQFRDLLLKYKFQMGGLLITVIPSVIASIIFYTREHYLLLVMPLVLFFLALILIPKRDKIDTTPRLFNSLTLIVVSILILAFKPTLKDYKTYDVWEEYTYPSNRKTIEAIRKMDFQQDIREIDHEGGLAVYVGKNFKWINLINKTDQSFSEFEKEYQPNFYYVTKSLLSNRFFTEDSQFMDIIHHPEKHGLHRIDLQKENKGYLLVQDSLKYHPINF
ncbi:MAG: hypothetical protein M9887_11915 [Chitinophagales bacterium]|nr:hypothetical protein [Chitinophagales bacterium]